MIEGAAATRSDGLDSLRGATVAAMLLVNNPGSWDPQVILPQLQHAAWNGWTCTDLVFPFFLFVVGVSLSLSLRRRGASGAGGLALLRHAAARAAALVLLGLMQARFPLLERHPRGLSAALAEVGPGGVLLRVALLGSTVAGAGALVASGSRRRWLLALAACVGLATVGVAMDSMADLRWLAAHLAGARVPGVLARIGVCGLAAACILVARPTARWWAAWAGGLLVVSMLATLYLPIPGFGRPDLTLAPDPSADATAARFSNWCVWIDTRVFGGRCHQVARDPSSGEVLWSFDPEGLGSTAGALVTVLLGAGVGRWLFPTGPRAGRIAGRLLLCGVAGMAAGALLDRWIPINKQLWTGSFALFTGGVACVALAACMRLPEAGVLRRAAAPAVWYGRNALVLFLGSSLCATLSIHLRVPAGVAADGTARMIPWKSWIYARLCEQLPPTQASLVHALGVVVVWAAVAGVLMRRRIFVRL